MTWNELIGRLQEIPENRREEKAIFCDPQEDIELEIDNLEPADGEMRTTDPELKESDMPFILTP